MVVGEFVATMLTSMVFNTLQGTMSAFLRTGKPEVVKRTRYVNLPR